MIELKKHYLVTFRFSQPLTSTHQFGVVVRELASKKTATEEYLLVGLSATAVSIAFVCKKMTEDAAALAPGFQLDDVLPGGVRMTVASIVPLKLGTKQLPTPNLRRVA